MGERELLELAVVLVYFVAMLAIGAIRLKVRGLDGFFVMGRRGSVLFITGSLFATIVGGSATVGMAGLGFKQGLTGVWWLLVGSVGLVVLGVFFAEKVRRFGLYTLPELLRQQYGERMGLAASVLIVIAWVGVIAGQIIAAGKIMSVLAVGTPVLWMVVFTLVFVTYTAVGGQYAVIRTDIFQGIILFIGIFAGLGFLLFYTGGIGGLIARLPPERLAFPLSSQFGGKELLVFLLLIGLTYVVGPDIYARLFSAKDARTARVSVLWTALFIVPLAFAITLTGMGASVLFPAISPEQAYPMVIKEVLPQFVGAIVLAGLLCAVMSSADTTLLSASTILSVDIIGRVRPSLSERQTLVLSRSVIVILGLAALALALVLKGIISALLFAYTIYTGGVIIPVIAGFYRDRLKVTAYGALAAIVCGGLAALASKIGGIKYLDIGALLIGVVLLFLVSAIERRVRSRWLDLGAGGD